MVYYDASMVIIPNDCVFHLVLRWFYHVVLHSTVDVFEDLLHNSTTHPAQVVLHLLESSDDLVDACCSSR